MLYILLYYAIFGRMKYAYFRLDFNESFDRSVIQRNAL